MCEHVWKISWYSTPIFLHTILSSQCADAPNFPKYGVTFQWVPKYCVFATDVSLISLCAQPTELRDDGSFFLMLWSDGSCNTRCCYGVWAAIHCTAIFFVPLSPLKETSVFTCVTFFLLFSAPWRWSFTLNLTENIDYYFRHRKTKMRT